VGRSVKWVVVIGVVLIVAGIVALLEKGMRDEDRINAEAERLAEESRDRVVAEEVDRFADDWEHGHNDPWQG
jgi:hypothetical protein